MTLGSVLPRVALTAGGSVVMPFPYRNVSGMKTSHDDELRRLEVDFYYIVLFKITYRFSDQV